MKKILCVLIIFVSILLNMNYSLAENYTGLISSINQSRIEYMKSQYSVDSEFESNMIFEYSEINDPSSDVIIFHSGLGETISLLSYNGSIWEIWFTTSIGYPLSNSFSNTRDVSKFLGLITVISISESFFGGTIESASTALQQLTDELSVQQNGTIYTNNMKIAYHGNISNSFASSAAQLSWDYEMIGLNVPTPYDN